jgi:hypothetical protein
MSWYLAQVNEPAAVQAFLDQVQRGAQVALARGTWGEAAQVLAEPVSYGLKFYFNEDARASLLFLQFTVAEECGAPPPEGLRAIV